METKTYTGNTQITPEAAGFDKKQLDYLDQFFAKHLENKGLQFASYLLARNGKIFANKSMGQLLPDSSDKPFLPDSIRWVASITKLFTAVAIMQLVDQGKIYLEQPLSFFFNEFSAPVYSDILIFNLLTHTAGLAPDPHFFQASYARENEYPQNEEDYIRYILSGPKYIQTGKQWVYSNDGFILLGMIISKVTGMLYTEYIQKNILDPLGMKETFYVIPDSYKERVAVITEWDKKHLNKTESFRSSPAGGILSTMNDMFCFGQMILNNGIFNGNRILSRKSIQAMSANQLPACTPAFCWGRDFKEWEYGLGIDISTGNITSKNTLNHEGVGRCALYMDPSEQFLAFYFIGIGDGWIAEAIENPRSITWAGII